MDLLWRQWAALGVSGHAGAEGRKAIDPDALLLASCVWGRYEPRLFDEMLDWLELNGWCVNVQRVRALLKQHDYGCERVLASVASLQAKGAVTAKWRGLAASSELAGAGAPLQPLFILADGRPQPLFGPAEPRFARFGFHRGSLELRHMSQPVNPARSVALLCGLRALFGVNARADILLYLLTHPEGHPPEMARQIGYFPKTIQMTLVEMANSGVIRTVKRGREKHYWVEPEKWGLLRAGADEHPTWPEWRAWPQFFAALAAIWKLAQNEELAAGSANLQAAEWRKMMEHIRPLLAENGLVFEITEAAGLTGNDYLKAVQEGIKKWFV